MGWEKIVGSPASSVYAAISEKASETLVKDRKRKSTTKEKIRRNKTKRSDNSSV